jgi:hypothetical protein
MSISFLIESVIRTIDLLLRILDNDPETFSSSQGLSEKLSLRVYFFNRQLLNVQNPAT